MSRIVNSNEGEELIIAPTSLLDALHPHPFGRENDGFANKDVERIYDRIFFFTDNSLKLSDDELVDVLRV